MRTLLIERIKSEIENNLRNFLREEGIELYVAANDAVIPRNCPLIEIEAIEDRNLEGNHLLREIRVMLGVLGKSWQCEPLIEGIYAALHPHHVTQRELTVLLMGLHIEAAHCVRPRYRKKRAIIRYIVEETPEPANTCQVTDKDDVASPEYC